MNAILGTNTNRTERFWRYVLIGDGCWEWQGRRNDGGYGFAQFAKKEKVLAHRASFEMFNGPIPAGLWVLHKCDNKRCVRPSHLYLGDNVFRGEDQGGSKLTWEGVRWIREEYPKGAYSQREMGTKLGVSQTAIYQVLANRTWIDQKQLSSGRLFGGEAH
jgi:hypothetical protein